MRYTILLLLLIASLAHAGTFTAASCSYVDVNAVINGGIHTAVDGDVINIPAGSCTWNSNLVVPSSIGITVAGSGTPNSSGATTGASASCASGTTITLGNGVQAFTAAPTFGNSTLRLSCFTLQPGSTSAVGYRILGTCTASGCPNLRMDNITFSGWSTVTRTGISFGIGAVGNMFGVIDHNTINGSAGNYLQLAEISHANYLGVGQYGDNVWALSESYGSANFLFIENNQFNTAGCCENEGSAGADQTFQGGGHIVLRFNTFANMDNLNQSMSWHGTESNGRPRTVRAWENYNNTWTVTSGTPAYMGARGGTGLTWGNTLSASGGGLSTLVNLNTYRAGASSGGWGPCDGTGSYDGTDGGSPYYTGNTIASYNSGTLTVTLTSNPGWTAHQWQSNGSPYSLHDVTQNNGWEIADNGANTLILNSNLQGVPGAWTPANGDSIQITRAPWCLDQAGGRGAGILYSGSTATPASSGNEILSPVYMWTNVFNVSPGFGITFSNTARVIQNRDFYAESQNQAAQSSPTTPFNGTTALGIGHGTLANRPTTCAVQVGYWATDTNTLYLCKTTNAWTASYTPYTYPHPLVGTGSPAVSLTPSSLTFSAQVVNTTSAGQGITLANTGTGTLAITSITVVGTNSGDFSQTNNCPANLGAGLNCTITVTFTPQSSGSRTANISVADNAAGSPQTVALTGTGIAPIVSFSTASLSFSLQPIGTTSAAQSVTLTNTGNATLTVSNLATTAEFVKTSSTCGSTLNAGASCTANIAFAPTGGGTRTGILQLIDNASGSPHSVALSGPGLVPGIVIQGNVDMTGNFTMSVASGAAPPLMAIAPSSLNFGSVPVGSIVTLPLTITNTGVSSLLFTSILVVDTANYSETDNCSTLLATQSCTVNVTFSPASVATLNTTLRIVANDAGSPHVVTVLGAGIAIGGDLPFPNFALQGGVAFLMPQVGVVPMVYSTQSPQQTVYIGNSTCLTAPARTNYLGVSKGATVCDFADSNGTGLQTVMNDWSSGTYGDQRWDVIVTHGSSFNFGATPWTWKDKYSGVPTINFLVFHSDTPNPRGRTVCSHGIQDVLTPPLPDAGQRNHGCQGYLGFPAVSVPIPVTNSAYTFDSTFNDLANMWTITSTASGTGSVIKMGPASTAGDPFGDCGGPCPTDGVNHIVVQDATILPASSVTISIVPVGIMAAEWIGNSGLSTHYLPAAPHDIGFDEDYFTADADDDGFGTNAINNHIQFACAKCWFNHNYADGVKRDGAEDHVLNLSNAPGPVQVSHNWIEGGSSALWGGGGAIPSVIGLLTTNVERRRNRLTYNQRWLPPPAGLQPFSKGVTGGSCSGGNTLVLNIPNTGSNIIANLVVYLKTITGVGTITNQWYAATSINSTAVTLTTTCTNGTVSATGSVYGFASNAVVTSAAAMNGKATSDPKFANPVAKNRSENKEGQSTIEDGEILENCGADGQSGFCLLVSVRACGGVSWCSGGESYMISDWASTNNIFRHGNQAFQISARSGGSNIRSWPVTAITCAADGNSAAITATGLNAGLSAPNTNQTVYGTDVYLASIGNGVSSGLPLLANGFYATAYPTGGNYAVDSVVTVKGTAICPANDTTAAGSVYGADSNNGAGVTLPGRRYVFQNNLIYDMGDHSQWNGGGSVTFVQNGAGNNNYTVNMTVTQVSPVVIVNAAVQAINACPVSQLCPKVLQAAVGDYAYIQCLTDNRFSTGGPKTKGVPILSVAGDQLSFTYTPQNGSPVLTLSDTTSCLLAALNSSTDSGYYNGQSFPWPSYWNHNTGVGVNLFVNGTGGGGFIKYSTYQNSFQLIPGTGDVAPADNGAKGGGFRCNNSDTYSASDATGITFCNDRPTFTYKRYVMANRAIANNPNFNAGTTCAPSCSQDPAINPDTNSTPTRVSTPGAIVTCGGVACDATHFIPDSVGISGSMGTSNYPLNLTDWRTYSLHSSSPYKAGGLLQATDGKDLGVQMSLIINAQNRTLYPCPLSCGTGLFRDGPQYGWMTWSASTDPGLINYRVYRDGSGSPTATVTSTFYTDYGLAAGGHTWIVKAWNGTIETTVSGLTSQVF